MAQWLFTLIFSEIHPFLQKRTVMRCERNSAVFRSQLFLLFTTCPSGKANLPPRLRLVSTWKISATLVVLVFCFSQKNTEALPSVARSPTRSLDFRRRPARNHGTGWPLDFPPVFLRVQNSLKQVVPEPDAGISRSLPAPGALEARSRWSP